MAYHVSQCANASWPHGQNILMMHSCHSAAGRQLRLGCCSRSLLFTRAMIATGPHTMLRNNGDSTARRHNKPRVRLSVTMAYATHASRNAPMGPRTSVQQIIVAVPINADARSMLVSLLLLWGSLPRAEILRGLVSQFAPLFRQGNQDHPAALSFRRSWSSLSPGMTKPRKESHLLSWEGDRLASIFSKWHATEDSSSPVAA